MPATKAYYFDTDKNGTRVMIDRKTGQKKPVSEIVRQAASSGAILTMEQAMANESKKKENTAKTFDDVLKMNDNHYPAGSSRGGQFAPKGGGGGGGDFDPFAVLMDMANNPEKYKDPPKAPENWEKPHAIVDGKDMTQGSPEERERVADMTIEEIMKKQGFDGKPNVVSTLDDFQKAVQENGNIACRGIAANSKEALDAYEDSLKNGEFFVECTGGSQYGRGMYMATSWDSTIDYDSAFGTANMYASMKSHGDVINITLDKSAKVVDFHDVLSEAYKDGGPFEYASNLGDTSTARDDIGAYAAAKGYDAIRCPNGYTIVLNRTKLTILDRTGNIEYMDGGEDLLYGDWTLPEWARKSESPTGCGVLVLRDGKVLTGTRIERASRGQICGPGGHIEAGETPEEAARREAMEEFGIECHDLTPLGTQDSGNRYGNSAVFLCTDYTGEPRTDEEEMTDPRWLTIEEAKSQNAFPPFLRSLQLLPERPVAKTFDEILKFNPYHDARGRFSSANGAHSFTIRTNSAAGQKAIANIKAREQAAGGGAGGTGSSSDAGNQETREHLGFMNNKEAVANTMKECGVSEQEAKDMVREISAYADGYAYEMRHWQQTGKTGGELTPDEAKAMEANAEKFIKDSPKWGGGEIYRGISLNESDTHKLLDKINAGEPVDMKGTSSWSSDRDTADDFSQMTAMGDDIPIIFKAPGTKKGTSIDHISEFSQSEVLVSKDARWDVKKIEGGINDGYLEITLEERP